MAKKPPVTVEVDVESADGESTQKASTTEAGASRQEKGSQPADAATNFKAQGAHARRLAAKTRSTAASWLEGLAPGHSNAVIFGVLGVVVALLIFWVGFFQALFVALMATAGVAFGQWLDGDPRIINAVKHLLASSNDYR